ncbi:MAG: elongation factor P [Firmicutes bacterium]|jgi:elongation factor P|nr:elongation factor P [Bacillota bacterium]
MISTNDLRTGVTIEIDGVVWSVVEFQHVKPGKGAAFVRTKLRNLSTGAVQERTFSAGERLNRARVENKEMQYLYSTGDFYTFMDNQTYEQMDLTAEQLGEGLKYLVENLNINVQTYEGTVIGVEMPNSVELTVTICEPGIRGDTASGGNKPATVETGLNVRVPFFINQGDKIRVDTRTGEYLGRV